MIKELLRTVSIMGKGTNQPHNDATNDELLDNDVTNDELLGSVRDPMHEK